MNNWHILHKKFMFDVLKLIYKSPFANILWFKWWTALYFFYWLHRFSVDLDFSLTENFGTDQIEKIKSDFFLYIQKHFFVDWWNFTIKIDWTLKNSFRFVLSYWWEKKIKIEVSSKMYDDKYEIKNLLWLQVKIMKIEYMFAHKLCAFLSRYKSNWSIANRDLFDIDFLLQKWFLPNDQIINLRTKNILGNLVDTQKYYQYLIEFIEKNKNIIQKNILDWLGDLVDEKQKKYVKNEMLENVLQQLSLRI